MGELFFTQYRDLNIILNLHQGEDQVRTTENSTLIIGGGDLCGNVYRKMYCSS